MKSTLRKPLFVIAIGSVVISAIVGCFGSGGTSPGVPTGEVTVQTYINGVLSPAANAILSGYTIPGYYSCAPNDTNCPTNFQNQYTNSSGQLLFSSDALPGTWNITAADANGCPGASSGWVTWSPSVPVNLICNGTAGSSNVTSNPSSCTTFWYTYKQSTTNCPSTVTLNVSSPAMPTSHAMVLDAFDETASKLAQNNVTASNSSQITAALPYDPGHDIIFTITDPNTSQVIGGALFVEHYYQGR